MQQCVLHFARLPIADRFLEVIKCYVHVASESLHFHEGLLSSQTSQSE